MTHLETQISQHINQLCCVIGPRPSGSAGCHAAAAYIIEQMENLGLKIEEQAFPCPAWDCEAIKLSQDGELIEAYANPYTPSCNVDAPLLPLATLAELETADLHGRIALLHGDLTRAPLSCKSWFLKDERDDRVITLLEQKKPAAILTVQIRPGSTDRLIEDWEFNLPSATLPAESGLTLLSHPDAMVSLTISTHTRLGSTANIVGLRPGLRPETIVVCAHYDTKIDTPGAGDNAAGVAAMLAAAELLSQSQLEIGMEFIAFTNEEYAPIGDDVYLQRRGESYLEHILLAINFDGLGHILDANTLASFSCSAALQSEVEQISKAYPGVQWVDPWPESNHSTFAMRGVPALALSSRALWHYSHQHDDTLRWISPRRVAEAASLAAQVVKTLQSRSTAWGRKPLS